MRQIVCAAVACAGLVGCAGGPAPRTAVNDPCAQVAEPGVKATCENREAKRQAYLDDLRRRPHFSGLQMVAPG